MKCPQCQSDNRPAVKFCEDCGAELRLECPNCRAKIPASKNFCGECGYRFNSFQQTAAPATENEIRIFDSGTEKSPRHFATTTGERKHVTVLFSDLVGYTKLSEKLDPEEVKEITTQIFDAAAKIVSKYQGIIEKFVGDAIMAIFGVTAVHEDDPVRAILAAREFHQVTESLNPKYESRIDQTLSMHSGINTGLVITGEVNIEKGIHGAAGDTINLASRLSRLAEPGEILVSRETYTQAEGHFVFKEIAPEKIKGKTEPVRIYKVLAPKDKPIKTHRIQGVKADLIGRKDEMAQLTEAFKNLARGEGAIFLIRGSAGTGKSRLVEEFKSQLDLKSIQWLEGHAYLYTQNVPYYPLIDMLRRAFQIEESDPPQKVKQKVDSGIGLLNIDKKEIVSYVGSLFALRHSVLDEVSPEFWKFKLKQSIQEIINIQSAQATTVICLEDLQWADPSSIELIRFILSDLEFPTLFLCTYRPTIDLLSSHQRRALGKLCNELTLQDLSLSETQVMVESLLKTDTIPMELRSFIQEKAGGNPFYLEELINSLIESKTLIYREGNWIFARPIGESPISSTIHGIISSRVDRLEAATKRILQEASVIGRAFYYDILKWITELKIQIDDSLGTLEKLDLIKIRATRPDLEYIFKHALTQEVIYKGLLRKERQTIHERIGLVMEELFQDRINEFYETLAHHFIQGGIFHKAIDYLIKSGEKSFGKYALEESHQYFQKAFDLMSNLPDQSHEEQKQILHLLNKWALVYNYRGDFSGLLDILKAHEELADAQNEKEPVGMFYAWLGWAMERREKLKDSYYYLQKSLKIGEKSEDLKVIGYSCAWLTHTCADLGLLDEAIENGKRAQEISASFKSDRDLYRFTMAGLALAHYFRGDCGHTIQVGKNLLKYGQKQFDTRSLTTGHYSIGYGHHAAGDFASAIRSFQKSIQVSMDPLLSYLPRLMLGFSYLSNGQIEEAEKTLEETIQFGETFGFEQIQTSAEAMLGIILISNGHLGKGLKLIETNLMTLQANKAKCRYALALNLLGRIYLQIVLKQGPRSLSLIARNIGFIVKNVPFAKKKAEDYFNKAIQIANETGAKGVLSQAYLNLGILYKERKLIDQAKKYFQDAIAIFERCEAKAYTQQAKDALIDL